MISVLNLNVQHRGAMSGVLTLGSLDPAFEGAPAVDGPVQLDLRAVDFVEPAGLCGLAALLELLTQRTEHVSLALSGRNVAAYLERMDFFRLFGGRVEVHPDVSSLEERERHNPGTLQELINFHTEEEIPRIINRISEILKGKEYLLRERVAICSTLSEICANAAEHGTSSFGAFAAVQAYNHIVSGSRRAGEEVIISIADGGPGIRETLARNPQYKDHTETDNEAIRHALEMGVSSTGELGRGGGLTLVAQISARSGGSLSIRSGAGRVTVYRDRKNSRNVPPFPGTFVRVSLPRHAAEDRP
ncbi:Histidine kinase-, DNA gyrase B-, and HSP90-like ATPase [Rubrobacter radiotolerans]|uniref:Histidine kinase-, DNA gyrase B-, and HSP90-like ATPase n=1 Tax=Rubrobacter radiotolerans TaxID=42256 RepID=A0A023WZL5_RUBRA|nr:Histidine kinase-, DNA gyrase B-, and HSP90-like ATPase [Rubrobacter radiotolerans]SMC02994.1 Histidine kinase-, DNA gyrase B-, and HSP90-like ATPase [Rubrobacter radiotolerans DSM 5868]